MKRKGFAPVVIIFIVVIIFVAVVTILYYKAQKPAAANAQNFSPTTTTSTSRQSTPQSEVILSGMQSLPQLSDDTELFNPMSGPYISLNQYASTSPLISDNPKYLATAPLSGTPLDEYGRLSWASLEPSEGKYNFSAIDNVLGACPGSSAHPLCLPQGTRFGFRIMALSAETSTETNVTIASSGYPIYSDLPAYLENTNYGWLLPVNPQNVSSGYYFLPDWNNPFFLARVNAFISALGQRYNTNPRIGWVEIGIYGDWGEWNTMGLTYESDYKNGIPYTSSSPYYNLNTQAYLANTGQPGAYQAGTTSTKDAIINDYVAAFPNKQLEMLTADNALCYALQIPGLTYPIGLRRDSLGSPVWTSNFPDNLPGCNSTSDIQMILSRWQTAPFITESFAAPPAGSTSSCGTFAIDTSTDNYDVDEQVSQFHVALIKNGSICSGPWSALSSTEQQAFTSAEINSGYRYSPMEIDVQDYPKTLSINTYWANTGVTPTYNKWWVEFSLWSQTQPQEQVAQWLSSAKLQNILPTGSTTVDIHDPFSLNTSSTIATGTYELEMQVVDPGKYLAPMELGLQGELPGGYYPLGLVTISR